MTNFYERNNMMIGRKIADELILVPIRQNVGDLQAMYTLNGVGARIWELVDGGRTVEQMRDILVAEYEVTPERVESDILEFLAQLAGIGAISIVAADTRRGS